MKTFAATLLMGLLLFNWLGFHLFYTVLQESSDRRLEARFDQKDYQEKELLTIKVPLHLPYFIDQQDFERVDGEITLNGIQYKFIKRKVIQDSVILICLPNHTKMQLTAAKSNYFGAVADLQHNDTGKSKQSLSHLKYLFTDFELKEQSWAMSAIQLPVLDFLLLNIHLRSFRSASLPGQPPEFLAWISPLN